MLEDSPEDAEIIQRTLKKDNPHCEFFLATEKSAFIQALDSFYPEVVLSDHSIPQFNSADALSIVRQKLRDVPFIMVTGAVSEEFAATIIRQGADDYILKDRMARLPAAIRAALAQKRALKEITDYKYALDQSAIVAITDQKGIILYANENFCSISKYSRDELIGHDHRIINSAYHPASFIRNLWVTIANGKSWQGEFRNKAKDGSIYWVYTHIVPFLNESGKPYQYLSIRHDITQKKMAEKELENSEQRLNEAQAIGHIANWEINLLNGEHIWSDELYRILCLDKNNTTPSTELLFSFIHADDLGIVKKRAAWARKDLGSYKMDFRFTAADGTSRYGHVEWRFDTENDKPYRLFGILQDITERIQAENNVKLLEQKMQEQKMQEQKKIARAVLKGQEKEQHYIGRELHDNVNQILAGAKMYLSSAGRKDPGMHEVIRYPMELIDNSIEEIRKLCQNLVVPQKNIMLNELVQDCLYNLGKHTGIRTHLTYTLNDKLIPDDLKLNILRIIQELLNNAVKYAAPSYIEVTLVSEGDFISVTVADNGTGFNTKLKRKGIGISNIIYRAECFNGKVSIKSSPGKGCKAVIRIPY